MELEQQVSNKELSLRLRELGVKQDSLFYHCFKVVNNDGVGIRFQDDLQRGGEYVISAFTVAELGEMLPKDWSTKGQYIEFENDEVNSMVRLIQRGDFAGEDCIHETTADTEADARAKMLVYLLENKLIEI